MGEFSNVRTLTPLEASRCKSRRRVADADWGRFLQPDPIGFSGDPANLYRYCGNNPANGSDPMGLVGPSDPPWQDQGDPAVQPQIIVKGTDIPFTLGQGLGPFTPTLLGNTPVSNTGATDRDPTVVTIQRIMVNAKYLKTPVVLGKPWHALNPFNSLLLNQMFWDLSSGPFYHETAIDRFLNMSLSSSGRYMVTHYGPSYRVGGWDPYWDSGTDNGIGNNANALTGDSLAISLDVARESGLSLGGPVYYNGVFVGNYDDTAPEPGRIDVYDPFNATFQTNWGGYIDGDLSSHP